MLGLNYSISLGLVSSSFFQRVRSSHQTNHSSRHTSPLNLDSTYHDGCL